MTKQTRREFLKTVGFMAGSAALPILPSCSSIGQITGRKQPNIIFIMTDDHASHALSCYGSKINRTPNLDRLAKEGMRFDNCFCTNSICAPSRAVILTGKYSHINGVTDNRLKFDGSQQTFPKLLQKVGYETAMIGKWHLKTDPTGFDSRLSQNCCRRSVTKPL
jgi:arylsulfatase A-like enzyme